MAVTRIRNNQITDAAAGNVYDGINAATKVQSYSVTSTKLANNLTYGSDLTITGNLTVNGNTTTIDTVNVVVDDPLLLLAAGQTGSPTLDIGFIGKRGTEENIAFVWDEANNVFVTAFTDSEITNTTIAINSYASFKTLDNTVTGALDVTGNTTVANFIVDASSVIDVGNNRITNVAEPSANADAATKGYVDSVASSGFTIEDDTANTTVVAGGDTLLLNGTANEVTVAITGVDEITFGLPDDVTLVGNLSALNLSATNEVYGATGGFTGNVVVGNLLSDAFVSGVTVTASGNLNGNNAVITGDVGAATGSFTGNLIAGNITSNGALTAASISTAGNLLAGNVNSNAAVTGVTITASGNLNGNNAVITNDVSATTGSFSGNVLSGNLNSNAAVTGVTVTASGNLNGNNAVITNDVSAVTGTFSGNVLAGNLNSNAAVTGVTITASGNLEGNNATITNGVFAATGAFTGNVIAGNLESNGAFTASSISTAGNLLAGNVNSNAAVTGVTITASGNLEGNNATITNLITAAAANISGNVHSGNLHSLGVIDSTGNINTPASVNASEFHGNSISVSGNVTAQGQVNTPKVVGASGLTIQSTGTLELVSTTDVIDVNGARITFVAEPTNSTDAATKQYVDDAVSAGLTIHTPVYVETPSALTATYTQGGTTATVTDTVAGNTVVFGSAISPQVNDQYWFTNSFQGIIGNIPYFVVSAPNTSAAVLSTSYNGDPVANITSATGLTQAVRVNSGIGATLVNAAANATLTIDGITMTGGERVLVYTQANAYENGVYVVDEAGNATTAWQMTRSTDTDVYGPKSTEELDAGDYFFVQAGLTGAGESYVMTAPIGAFIIGYSNVTFTQFSASSTYSANTQQGLVLNGTVFSAKVDNDTTAFDVAGNIIVKAGANLVTPNIGDATGKSLTLTGNGYLSATTVSVTGNVDASYLNAGNGVTGQFATFTANVAGGNLTTLGNASANFFIGNGSQLTGVTASAVDANALTGNTLAYNVIYSNLNTVGTLVDLTVAGTANVGNLISNGFVDVTGNVLAGNVNSNAAVTGVTITASGNVLAGNVNSNASVTGVTITASGNLEGNNAVITGDVGAATGSFTGNVIAGNITSNGAFTAASISTAGNVLAGNVNSNAAVTGVDGIFSGNVLAGNLNSNAAVTGVTITASGNLAGNNAVITGDVGAATGSFTGNVIAGNITSNGAFTAASISTAGNVLAGNVNSNAAVTGVDGLFSGNVLAGNLNSNAAVTGVTITASGNLAGNNAVITGDVGAATGSFSGNVSAGNVSTTNVSATGQANLGNIVISGDDITGTNGQVLVNSALADVNFIVSGDTIANLLVVDAGTDSVIIGSGTPTTGAALKVGTTDSMMVPVGNIGQRPATGVTGMMRFNTSTNFLEYYDSDSWVPASAEFTVIVADSFVGNGVQTVFTLSAESTTAGTIVAINGVVQIPVTAYAVSGTTLTFTEAPEPSDVIDARILTTTTSVTAIEGAAGGLLEGDATLIQFDVTGNLVPSTGNLYNLGDPTHYWNTLYVGGNSIHLGSLILRDNGSNTFAVYTADGTTEANIAVGNIDVTSIQSGTSLLSIEAPNGNIISTAGGNNTMIVTSTGANVTGYVTATGNVSGANLTTAGAITATGNITGGNIITNGNVTAANFSGNISFPAGGVVNTTGNITGGNLVTGGVVSATGNITGGNITTAGTGTIGTLNVTGEAVITGNLTVNGTTTTINSNTITTNDLAITLGNNQTTGTALNGAGIDIGSNGLATWKFNNATTSWQSNIAVMPTSNGTLTLGGTSNYWGATYVASLTATGNVSTGNVSGTTGTFTNVAGTLTTAAQTNITSVGTLSGLAVSGNASAGNLSVTTGAVTLGSIVNANANGVGNIGSSTGYFNTVFAKATSAQYADLAEKYEADAEYAPGTVVAFGGAKEVTLADEAGSTRVAGVVSTNPSYIMNATLEAEHVALVALQGRVPCKVIGPVRKGDMMVAAGNGAAKVDNAARAGTIIGKALENFDGAEGTIEVVIGRN